MQWEDSLYVMAPGRQGFHGSVVLIGNQNLSSATSNLLSLNYSSTNTDADPRVSWQHTIVSLPSSFKVNNISLPLYFLQFCPSEHILQHEISAEIWDIFNVPSITGRQPNGGIVLRLKKDEKIIRQLAVTTFCPRAFFMTF